MSGAAAAATIFALSSGAPPAAIAIIRISGPEARAALTALAGEPPPPRLASLRALRDPAGGGLLDRALILWNPAPATATGEDVTELHCHGGRAVVAAVLRALGTLPGLRPAAPGEFTRRALENGRIDLADAEGLADLLTAETEAQRRIAVARTDGGLARLVDRWRQELVGIMAVVEAGIEYEDDDDSITAIDVRPAIATLTEEIRSAAISPPAERIRDGFRVVIAGPPNSGKSTLLNAIAGRSAALVSERPGTTRDVIEVPVSLAGLPFLFCDTAGLRDTDDDVEGLGIVSARERIATADLLLWLGDTALAPKAAMTITIASKADIVKSDPTADLAVSARTGEGLQELSDSIVETVGSLLSPVGGMLNQQQQHIAASIVGVLQQVRMEDDPLLLAEHLRSALERAGGLLSTSATDDVLASIFERFCIGK